MERRQVRRLLTAVRRGRISVAGATEQLQTLPFEDLTYAKVDHHRSLRRGFPEVVYGAGKTVGQVVAIAERLLKAGHPLVITKARAEVFARLRRAHPRLRYDATARLIATAPSSNHHRRRRGGLVAVVTAGTSDAPVASEAVAILRLMGQRVVTLDDVGVAGLHRLMAHWALLRRARTIIVVAGMEGALASVVSGLVARPVIAVPTSVGYGAAFQGLAPLLTMLNSCSPGVAVVNIDNGFGAGYLAGLINT